MCGCLGRPPPPHHRTPQERPPPTHPTPPPRHPPATPRLLVRSLKHGTRSGHCCCCAIHPGGGFTAGMQLSSSSSTPPARGRSQRSTARSHGHRSSAAGWSYGPSCGGPTSSTTTVSCRRAQQGVGSCSRRARRRQTSGTVVMLRVRGRGRGGGASAGVPPTFLSCQRHALTPPSPATRTALAGAAAAGCGSGGRPAAGAVPSCCPLGRLPSRAGGRGRVAARRRQGFSSGEERNGTPLVSVPTPRALRVVACGAPRMDGSRTRPPPSHAAGAAPSVPLLTVLARAGTRPSPKVLLQSQNGAGRDEVREKAGMQEVKSGVGSQSEWRGWWWGGDNRGRGRVARAGGAPLARRQASATRSVRACCHPAPRPLSGGPPRW